MKAINDLINEINKSDIDIKYSTNDLESLISNVSGKKSNNNNIKVDANVYNQINTNKSNITNVNSHNSNLNVTHPFTLSFVDNVNEFTKPIHKFKEYIKPIPNSKDINQIPNFKDTEEDDEEYEDYEYYPDNITDITDTYTIKPEDSVSNICYTDIVKKPKQKCINLSESLDTILYNIKKVSKHKTKHLNDSIRNKERCKYQDILLTQIYLQTFGDVDNHDISKMCLLNIKSKTILKKLPKISENFDYFNSDNEN